MVQACFTIPTVRRRAPSRRRVQRLRPAHVQRARRSTGRRAAPSRRRQARRQHQQRQLTKYELCNLNPFDARCMGAKIPDSNTQPSETTIDENRIVITTDALGNAATKAFNPNLVVNAVNSVVATPTTWTWNAAYGGQVNSANAASIIAEYSGLRPVGHGIRIACSSAPLNVTGFVHICISPIPTFAASTWALPTSITQMTNQPWYKRFTLASLTQRSVTVVNKFLDASATRYTDPNSDWVAQTSDVEFQFAGSWCSIIIAVEGAPVSTSPVTVDTISHFEGLPKIGTNNSSTPAAQYNVRELEEVSRIATSHPGTFQEGEEAGLIASALRSLTGHLTQTPGWSMAPIGGIPGVNTPRLTSY